MSVKTRMPLVITVLSRPVVTNLPSTEMVKGAGEHLLYDCGLLSKARYLEA